MKTELTHCNAICLARATTFVLVLLCAGSATAQWSTGTNISNTNSGNVGVGTTSPDKLFSVQNKLAINTDGELFWGSAEAHGKLTWDGGLAKVLAQGSNDLQLLAGSGYVYVANGGNVGIGTATPGSKLEVNGTISATNVIAKFQDVAEWVPASEHLSAGTVVVLDSSKSNQVTSSFVSYDTRVAGVVSEQPGIALGEKSESKVLVATTGRVKVKVDASKGAIHIGDLLVTSEIPGLAMKSEPVNLGGVQLHRPGTLIGKALEPLEKGSGSILVLLSLQ